MAERHSSHKHSSHKHSSEGVVVTLSGRDLHVALGPVVTALVAAAAVVTLLTGCSSGSTTTPGTTTPGTTTSMVRRLSVSVTGRTVTPAPAQVDLAVGETLSLTVTIDHADELHAHGFEIEKTLPAHTPTTITLAGAAPGVYEVETHEPALTLLTVAVR